MRAVLGIDAAWTETNPSGVALVEETLAGWRLHTVKASYGEFCGGGAGNNSPDVWALLNACRVRLGRLPDLIAVDMPMAFSKIEKRRKSDTEISRIFGPAKAATHSPSKQRPGPLSDKLREDFEVAGYPLCTFGKFRAPGILEVYPHTALIALTGDQVRLQYKVAKTRIYWPEIYDITARRVRLREVWQRIVTALEEQILGVLEKLPVPGPETIGGDLKAYEDRLDAVVCAYAAIAALEGRARAYGDADSAIWVPLPSRS